MQSPTNCDIWFQVLQYVKLDPIDDSWTDLRTSRRTILSVALVHPDLVDVALNELWRSMVSLEPIVRVINTSLMVPKNVLEYNEDVGLWVSANC